MVNLSLPRNVFQEYQCTDEHDICVGVSDLVKVSKRMAGDDRLIFNLDESENRFEIKMMGDAVRTFKLHLLAPPSERTQKIVPSFDVKAEMHADAFKRAIKDIGVVSNHLRINARTDTISFAGEGDTGEVEVVLGLGADSVLYTLTATGQVSSMYALSYLTEIIKAISSDSVILQLTGNRPILVEFSIAESGVMQFLLAPRIERS